MKIIEPLIKPKYNYPETLEMAKKIVELLEKEELEEAEHIYWEMSSIWRLRQLKMTKDSASVNSELAKKYYYGENI